MSIMENIQMSKPSICFIGEGTVSDEIRMNLTGLILSKRGYKVVTSGKYNEDGSVSIPEPFEIAIFSRPHAVKVIESFKKRGVKIIVDQDDDFWNIYKGHVAYNGIGPGNKKALKLVEECIELADAITTPSPVLANQLRKFSEAPIHIIPNGWSKENTFWAMKRNKFAGPTVNIGWAGTITHRTDFLKCKNAVVEVLEQYENTKVVIGQDAEIYQMFDKFPEDRKLFLPPVPYSFYPIILSYIDIWLAPLQDNKFNASKSDIKLVDAGARVIPWIASPMPAYSAWKWGGILANTPDEWKAAIISLLDPERRVLLGEVGWTRALDREQENIVDAWELILEGL